jgi:hypothetical protein
MVSALFSTTRNGFPKIPIYVFWEFWSYHINTFIPSSHIYNRQVMLYRCYIIQPAAHNSSPCLQVTPF